MRDGFNNAYYGNAELNEGNASLLREDLLRTSSRLVEARNGETELTDKCEVDGSVGPAPIAIAPGRAAELEHTSVITDESSLCSVWRYSKRLLVYPTRTLVIGLPRSRDTI